MKALTKKSLKGKRKGNYKVAWMQPITDRPISERGAFKAMREFCDTQREAVELFLKLEADPATQFSTITSPEELGFRSVRDMELYLQGEIEKSSEYYTSLGLDY